MHLQLYFEFCGPVPLWSRVSAALWGRESHRLAAGCTGSSWVHRRHDGHKWIASCACTSTIHLPCLFVCLVSAHQSQVSISIHFHVFSQPVLRGALTLGNWLILALCTSIRHRRVSKTLPSSASI